MDLLQKELERKKKALQSAKSGSSRYVRVGDLKRKKLEDEAARLDRKRTATDDDENVAEKKKKTTTSEYEETSKDGDDVTNLSTATKTDAQQVHDEVAQLSPQELTEKLRVMGLPVRLFGELSNHGRDESRRDRLRQALSQHHETLAGLKEQDEFRLEKGHTIRNTFLEKDDTEASAGLSEKDSRVDNQKMDDASKEALEEKALPTDPHKRIYKYFKGLLRTWEDDLSKRPEEVKRSVAGKKETKTMQQCRDYINPLFKQCKKRQVEEGQLQNILKIVDFCIEGEFVKAHDAYMDVAIGRAAWPIGVTMVGIHARTGRAKIESSNVAHVMNSELQRKYLTSIKRLMTFAQRKRPDIHPSKKVVN